MGRTEHFGMGGIAASKGNQILGLIRRNTLVGRIEHYGMEAHTLVGRTEHFGMEAHTHEVKLVKDQCRHQEALVLTEDNK